MTTTPFTCDTFAEHLADHLEREDTPAVRDAMEAHAASCAACGALLADIAAIREEAAALPTLTPSRDLWGGIAARIEAPVVPLAERRTGGERRKVAAGGARFWRHPALMAAALVGITAGVTHVATRQALRDSLQPPVAGAPVATTGETAVAAAPGPVADAPGAVAEGVAAAGRDAGASTAPGAALVAADPARGDGSTRATPAPVASFAEFRDGDMAVLDSLYYREIVRLRQITNDRRQVLDSTTVQVLDRNLAIIDRAILECRAALARDPASHYLNEQLNHALESKIELLRSAATLPIGS